MGKMKTFKAEEWDLDAIGDNTYQELFKASKKKKHKQDKPKILVGKIKKSGKQKGKLKKALKNEFSVEPTEDKNIHDAQINTITKSMKRRLKRKQKLQKKLESALNTDKNNTVNLGSMDCEKNRKKEKLYLKNISDKHLENGIMKKQKKMLKQFTSELNSLHSDSVNLENELRKEEKRQKKLKKELKKASKQMLLSQFIESNIKNKFETLEKIKKKSDILDGSNEGTSNIKKKKELLQKHEKKRKQTQVIHESLKKKEKEMQVRLKTTLNEEQTKRNSPVYSLRQKMMEKLKAARFRFLNEQIYTTDSKEAQKIFKSDPEAFNAYHDGYRQQVRSWPLNPVDVIIKSVKKMPKTHIIADFGCGDAKLAKSIQQKVHSFDLVAVDESVVACDMAKVPLEGNSIDVAIFCLSLMGTNLHDYLLEANRVLKIGGTLKIAEVESRFDNVDNFIEGVGHFGFKKIWKDLSHNLFYFLDFKKENNVKNKKKVPTLSLLPCLYKKR